MGDVVKLSFGRVKKGRKLPKPVECRECEEPIETARLQLLEAHQVLKPWRCVSCAKLWERRFENQMRGVGENQAVEVIR